ncbi:MAG: HAMP domain-containing sensor histidine kinase [Verrucomicrobiota bacterium]
MFSAEQYPQLTSGTHIGFLVDRLWKDLCGRFGYQAVLLAELDFEHEQITVVSNWNVPREPFNGAEASALLELVSDCFKRFPERHIHAISHLPIAAILNRLSHGIQPVVRATFIPAEASGRRFIFFGFHSTSSSERSIPAGVLAELDLILCVISHLEASAQNIERLRVTEIFVKEVGHDIASCVQAIVAKLRTIRDGRVPELEALRRKVAEIEREINSTYAIADMLGLAIDPNYQLRSFADFDLANVLDEAISQLSGEAQERNITFDVKRATTGLKLWGDQRAIQQCLIQILMNAIKYSFGGTFIRINVTDRGESIAVHVRNRGHELPSGDERKLIWDFGMRGKKAKELHVNGSGIGLFTVKKIVTAHRGRAWAESEGENTTVSIDLPKVNRLKAELGLLI